MLSVVRFPLDWLKDQYLVPSSSSIDFLLLRLFKLWVCFRLYDFLWICPYSSSINVVEKWVGGRKEEKSYLILNIELYHLASKTLNLFVREKLGDLQNLKQRERQIFNIFLHVDVDKL